MPKRVRVRQHVNPLKLEYALGPAEGPVALPDGGEIEVELGCADAQFLFHRAARLPALTCIGVEIRKPLVDDVNLRAAEDGLPNLRAVYANVNVDLPRLFPDGRLARIFLNFPDPWFKRRHQKRRVMTPDVAETIAQKLAPGGTLFFQSDVFELALDAMAVLEEAGPPVGLVNVRGPWSFVVDNPYGARSQREERCEAKGMRIWRLRYDRAPAVP